MVTATPDTDVDVSKDLLFEDRLSADELVKLSDQIRESDDLRKEVRNLYDDFEEHINEFSSENRGVVRKATIAWLLGNPGEALELLDKTQPSRESRTITALSHKENRDYHIAEDKLKEVYEEYKDQEEPKGFLLSNYVECLLKLNRIEDAREVVDSENDQFSDDPYVPYIEGFVNEMEGKPQDALDSYQDALEIDPDHVPSLFREAILIERQAEEVVDQEEEPEEYARSVYEQILKKTPTYEGTVMNLGLLYEDQEEYERATDCYQMVLEEQPANQIAELYLGDAEASMNLSFREERMRERVEMGRMLNKPITNFDFPQRILDAFDQLNVETLGDLIQCTDEQLLACDNFGQYSLDRVKKFLDDRNLSLSNANRNKVTLKPNPPSEDVDDTLKKKIEDFDWSARSKRAMKRLSIYTLNDLVEHTEEELLDCQNFGETSLQEVKDTLSDLGLSLKES